MLVLEGTTIYEKGKPVGKLELQEGQRSEVFIIVESAPGALREVQLSDTDRKSLKLMEASGKGPKVLLTLEGVFQRADTVNANNRIYPDSIWKKVLDPKEKWLKMVSDGDMLGEADHPKDGETLLSRVAGMVTDVHRSDENSKELMGRMVVFDTTKGRDLKAIHDGGGRLGVSSRGQGSVVRMDGKDVVQEDYDLQTWDVVFNPSTSGAYPKEVEESAAGLKESTAAKAAAIHEQSHKSARPEDLSRVLEVMSKARVDTAKPIVESVAEIRTAYKKAVGVDGPLSPDEMKALTLYVETAYAGNASVGSGDYVARINFGGTLNESVRTVEIRAKSEEELKHRIAEALDGVPSFVTVEVDKSEVIYEECSKRFGPMLEAQISRAQEASDKATKAMAEASEVSAKLAAAKQLIEKFAARTKNAEGNLTEAKEDVDAAEKLIEAMAEEFFAEGLSAGVAALAATHPTIDGLPEALSKAISLTEAVAITNRMKADKAVFLEREPLGIRNVRIEAAIKASKEKETAILIETTVEKKETPAFSTTKSVVKAMQQRGLK